MHSHFLRAVFLEDAYSKCQREKRVKGDPAGLMLEERQTTRGGADGWKENQQPSLTEKGLETAKKD
ncbi:hypothetical protein [Cytobacillus oceanisediminis]|uniref:Uncharacterized protein n=1 Tax=Cytobacillus oceanisediminis TaxID=665099 RepID=A0A562JDT5_9BACI|nr:hypothetical protein [Cytobacillus oceanisediminis]TWH81298.1 hypothetical protein IQ19_04341 [Cytobacillus oceanisediminis]